MSNQQSEQQDWRNQEIKYDVFYFQVAFGLMAIVAAVIIGFLLFPDDMGYRSNLYTTAVGVLITVSVLDLLSRRREERQKTDQIKEELIADMGSRENTVANHAVEQLRRRGWLIDGTLQGADLWEANLENAVLFQANLANAVLHRARLQRTNLSEANLSGAELNDAQICDSHLQDTDMCNANLRRVNFLKAHMLRADLCNANCEDANFAYTWLVDVNFSDAKLGAANLQGANLLGANLCGAELSLESKLISSTGELIETNIIPARFNTDTTLPDGSKWQQDTDMRRFTEATHPNFWSFKDGLLSTYDAALVSAIYSGT